MTSPTDIALIGFIAWTRVQSCIHLASISPAAVTARFIAFAVQRVMGAVWVVGLLAARRMTHGVGAAPSAHHPPVAQSRSIRPPRAIPAPA